MPTTPPPPPSINDVIESTDGHFQIVVPNFASATPVLPLGSTPPAAPVQLSSFLRLGTAATTAAGGEADPPSTFGPQLLAVALASTPIATGNLFEDGITDGDANALSPPATSAPAAPLFSDDVRDQGAANNANGLTPEQRVAESQLLLTKGGWRDHTDGNRITTTYGDKVEVIRGNLKMVVLGRQDVASNGHIFESSGGMLQDNDAAPGQITEISWVETGQGTWRVVETCTKGDVDSTYDGKVVERFVGGSVTTIVGKESQATATTPLAAFTDADASTSTDPTIARMYLEYTDAQQNAYVDASVTFTDYVKERGYSTNGGSSSLDFYHQEQGGSNPYVLEQTWATRIESYTGSAKTPVPNIIEETYAGSISETTNADSITETTNAGSITETTGSSGSPVATITEDTYATHIQETTTATTIVEKKIISGNIDEVTVVPLATQTFTGALFDTHLGFKWETIVGAWGAARLGAALEVFLGLGAEVNIGPALEINLGLSVSYATCKLENEPTNLADKGVTLKSVGASLISFGFWTAT
jgi:hypothetical protein